MSLSTGSHARRMRAQILFGPQPIIQQFVMVANESIVNSRDRFSVFVPVFKQCMCMHVE